MTLVSAPEDGRGKVVGAGIRIAWLGGEAGQLSEPLGVGIGVRIRLRPPGGPFLGEIAVEHDRFARALPVEVEIEGERGAPTGETIVLHRSQRLALTRMLVGVAWSPAWRRVQPRLGVSGGAALAFFLHPGAEPISVSRWKGLVRTEAALAVRVYRQVWGEIAAEYNVLLPDATETFDLRDAGGRPGPMPIRPFGNYAAATANVLYSF